MAQPCTDTFSLDTSVTNTATLTDDNIPITDLQGYTFSISEDTDGGWILTSAECVNTNGGEDRGAPGELVLLSGDDVTCTFINSRAPVVFEDGFEA